ncbi:MAG: NAD(P)-dependent oxidoreductase [Polyangiaceae bacterium]|nr:NAD(P)-dependent oxidoreductase [Myxococcales bacterium]MCB9590679.1 NAD(P)-dependent oxidoreductase [Polyangiaceae bacterium]
MAHIAFIGTGLIGGGLIAAAAERGETLRVFNRTRSKAEALAGPQVSVSDSVQAAVDGATRVHVVMSDDSAVDACLEPALEALRGKLLIDHTTASPAGTAKRAARLAELGVRYLHAPVFMSPAMCRQAGGMMLAAGPQATFTAAEPALKQMTGKVLYLGERADLAAAYKLFGNAMIIGITGALADVLTMAQQLGIEPTEAQQLFTHFNPVGTLTYRGANMAAGKYDPSFELTMARKDVRLMQETAGDATLCVLPGIAERMESLIQAGHGALDLAALSIEAVPPKA